MSHEERAKINDTKDNDGYLDSDSEKMERKYNNDTKEIRNGREINVNGDIKVRKDELIEGNEKDEESAGEDICRDFLNNICSRGSRCKFYHPLNVVRRASQQTQENIEYQFCIDYQNRGCNRDNCRYIHAQREDIERYKMTGEMTLNIAREIAAIYNCDTINGIPFCKEYQIGSCSRGGQRCRYWHINVEEERERRRRVPRSLPTSLLPSLAQVSSLALPYSICSNRRSYPHVAADICSPYGKRMRYDLDDDYVRDLERRNAELGKEVEGLKRELSRERERYGDLYALFRQRTAIITTQQNPINVTPVATAYYQSASSTCWTDTKWTH
ncbi:Zinc finger C-x8-C-x5-C-x3-H type (and similar) family protein [Acanthocheilonema viteae]|uniref:C3H1-type domain-containing protein n=1 Tax=Acanthocheilonema viteae TaxID=6277 RepID=A0A498S4S6_ACAVI|nr:unnamed protein product [Acanthocheilonema viteae]